MKNDLAAEAALYIRNLKRIHARGQAYSNEMFDVWENGLLRLIRNASARRQALEG